MIFLHAGDVFATEFTEVGKIHHSATDHEIKLLFALCDVAMLESDVGQADLLCYRRSDTEFLADTVDEMEMAVGEHCRQWYAGQSTATAEVENFATGSKANELGDSKTVKDMVDLEVVDILA